jgi:hypothetical protein
MEQFEPIFNTISHQINQSTNNPNRIGNLLPSGLLKTTAVNPMASGNSSLGDKEPLRNYFCSDTRNHQSKATKLTAVLQACKTVLSWVQHEKARNKGKSENRCSPNHSRYHWLD